MSTPTDPQPIDPLYASLHHAMTSLLNALPLDPRGTPEDHAIQRHAAVATLGTLHPNNPVQHTLAARSAASHFAAMECFRQASQPDQPVERMERLMRLADRMDRMVERTLDRLKSDQMVHRRSTAPSLLDVISTNDRQHPMPSEKSPAHPPAPAPSPTAPANTPTRPQPTPTPENSRQHPMPSEKSPVSPAAVTRSPPAQTRPQPAPKPENGRQHPMPSERNPEVTLPLDPEAWLASLGSLTPEEQQAFTTSMQLLGQPNPARPRTRPPAE